MVQNILKAMVW